MAEMYFWRVDDEYFAMARFSFILKPGGDRAGSTIQFVRGDARLNLFVSPADDPDATSVEATLSCEGTGLENLLRSVRACSELLTAAGYQINPKTARQKAAGTNLSLKKRRRS